LEENLLSADDHRWLKFVKSVIERTADDEHLIKLSTLVSLLDEPIQNDVNEELREHVVRSWRDKISTAIADYGIATDYIDTDSESEYDKARDEIQKFVANTLSDYSITFCSDDISAIVDEFDIYDHMSDNQRSYCGDEGGGRPSRGASSGGDLDQIDDLFERDR
jgi:hypothetical protein